MTERGALRRWARSLMLTAGAGLWAGPYLWMTLTSFKTLPEIVAAPTWPLPHHWDLGAYREVLHTIPVLRYLGTSVLVATLIAVLQIGLALPAGYALAKLRFVGRKFAFGAVLACLLVPVQLTFVPIFALLGRAHLVNTLASLVLPFGVSALGTYLVRQAMLQIPDSIVEAARLDGASELRIIYGLLGPLVRPTLTSLFLFSFVSHYNDYFWPLVMTTDDQVRTLPLAIALLREQGTGVRWHVLMAGNVLLSLPMLALFAAAQKHLLRAVSLRG